MWISKLDDALRGDPTFKALMIWLLSLNQDGHNIFEKLHMTREPETSITTSFSYGEDEFFAYTHYDAINCGNRGDYN